MIYELMEIGSFIKITPEQAAELAALAILPDAQIDTRDVPEQRDWSGSLRGVFFRPMKEQPAIEAQ